MSLHIPFRYDYVGSFLRPTALKEAREAFKAGTLTAEELRAVENKEIEALIAKQKAAGYHVITDGEFRRAYWHLDFMWGFQGIEETELDHGYFFVGEETAKGSIKLVGKISGENHPFIEHFKFVNQWADANTVAKQTFPAPAQLFSELFRDKNGDTTRQIYPDVEELIQDIGAAYRTFIKELYEAGCRNIQLDDCTWGMFCDEAYWQKRQETAKDNLSFEEAAERFLRLNNLALQDIPADLAVTTHVCRGNYNSTYAASGSYERIEKILFGKAKVDAFYLEFDDERSGGFEPLRFVPANKKVVLGLITTKRATLENRDGIIKRIQEATQYVPLEHLYLSPQCGFASCEIGNKLTEEEQWAKLALVKSIAEEVWGHR